SHPLTQLEKELRRFATHAVEQIRQLPAGQEATLGVMLSQVRYRNTQKARNGNSRFLRCKAEDMTGAVECLMWPDDLVRHKDEVQEERPVVVKGVVDRARDEPTLVLSRILSVEQARKELARGLYLLLKVGVHRPSCLDALAAVLARTPGSCPVYVTVRDAG